MLTNFIKKLDSIFFFGILKKANRMLINILNKKLKNKNINHLNKKYIFKNTSYFNNDKNILSELSEKFVSDKGYIDHNINKKTYNWEPHSYTHFYNKLFNHCRGEIKLVLECGISEGGSLRMWKEFFFNANIYGADIDKNLLFKEDRIQTYHVDQLSKSSIDKMWQDIKIGEFDIIIDDGYHSAEGNIVFFLNSFNKLKKNGIYIVEDVKYRDIGTVLNKLDKFNPEIIILESLDFYKDGKREEFFPKEVQCGINGLDNNLILIRKS